MATKLKNHVERFEGMTDFLSALPVETDKFKGGDSWTNGEKYTESRKLCFYGWQKSVTSAESMIDSIESAGILTRGTAAYRRDVAGAFPNVPAFLAGEPESMWRRDMIDAALSEQAPMNIYLDVCCSGGITASQVEARGHAVIALVMALSERRPVELYLYSGMGNDDVAFIPVVKIETKPLDIAAASYAIASSGFMRNLCFTYADMKSRALYGRNWQGHWAWNLSPRSEPYRKQIQSALNITDSDLIIYGGHLQESSIREPVKWVKEQLELHMPNLE